jgi:four helix bundle protein
MAPNLYLGPGVGGADEVCLPRDPSRTEIEIETEIEIAKETSMGFKFERLDTWKKAIEYVDAMFEIADSLPQRYQFSLGEQLRRAATSIANNIAEGTGRDNPNEAHYLFGVSKGSVYETVNLMVIIGRRGHLEREIYRQQYQAADELAAMITGLTRVQHQG